mmetsp:Transcript_106411/g.300934  ORF Transcript_106411/g.300934 Transcript_106411/m.300934 type:complete len:322 (-) Transcript_106411:269-1234(-)
MQTTSWDATSSCSRCTSLRRVSGDWCGCPGIGISSSTASASASGITALTASHAATAFDRPCAASSCVKRLWRTGLDKETLPLSTNVMRLTPQPISVRARWQPSVPAPRSRNRRPRMRSGSSSGSNLHFMSLIFRSTASAAMRRLSMKAVRSKFWIFVQPANCASAGVGEASAVAAAAADASRKKTCDRAGTSAALEARLGSRKARNRLLPGACCATARTRFLIGQPGAPSAEDGSTKATARSPSAAEAHSGRAASLRTAQASEEVARTSTKAPAHARSASSRSCTDSWHSSSRLKPASAAPQHGANVSHEVGGVRTGKDTV